MDDLLLEKNDNAIRPYFFSNYFRNNSVVKRTIKL